VKEDIKYFAQLPGPHVGKKNRNITAKFSLQPKPPLPAWTKSDTNTMSYHCAVGSGQLKMSVLIPYDHSLSPPVPGFPIRIFHHTPLRGPSYGDGKGISLILKLRKFPSFICERLNNNSNTYLIVFEFGLQNLF